MPRDLRNVRFTRVALVDKGANFDRKTGDGAHIVLVKRDVSKDSPSIGSVHVDVPGDERDDWEKAVLSSETRNNLPDSSFAAVWTDASGKKQRKLPYKNADGSLNHSHWANALARIDGSDIPDHVKAEARRKLEAARPKEKRMTIKDLFKSILGAASESDAAKRQAEVSRIAKALDTPGSPEHEAAESHAIQTLSNLHPDHVKALKAHHEMIGKMIQGYGEGPHPEGHPVHELKAMHERLGKALANCPPDADGDNDMEMDKAVEKMVTDRTASLEKRLKDAEAALQVETEKRLDAEMVDILKNFKTIPFDMEKDVQKFRKMRQVDPDAYNRTMELLKAADAQNKDNVLFGRQIGSDRSGTPAAYAKLEGKAEEIRKRDTSITKEAAFEQACLENPGLVAEYRREQQ